MPQAATALKTYQEEFAEVKEIWINHWFNQQPELLPTLDIDAALSRLEVAYKHLNHFPLPDLIERKKGSGVDSTATQLSTSSSAQPIADPSPRPSDARGSASSAAQPSTGPRKTEDQELSRRIKDRWPEKEVPEFYQLILPNVTGPVEVPIEAAGWLLKYGGATLADDQAAPGSTGKTKGKRKAEKGTGFDYMHSPYYTVADRIVRQAALGRADLSESTRLDCIRALTLIIAWLNFPLFRQVANGRWMTLGVDRMREELKMRADRLRINARNEKAQAESVFYLLQSLGILQRVGVVPDALAGGGGETGGSIVPPGSIAQSEFDALKSRARLLTRDQGGDYITWRCFQPGKTLFYRLKESISLESDNLPPFNPFLQAIVGNPITQESYVRLVSPSGARSIVDGESRTIDGRNLSLSSDSNKSGMVESRTMVGYESDYLASNGPTTVNQSEIVGLKSSDSSHRLKQYVVVDGDRVAHPRGQGKKKLIKKLGPLTGRPVAKRTEPSSASSEVSPNPNSVLRQDVYDLLRGVHTLLTGCNQEFDPARARQIALAPADKLPLEVVKERVNEFVALWNSGKIELRSPMGYLFKWLTRMPEQAMAPAEETSQQEAARVGRQFANRPAVNTPRKPANGNGNGGGKNRRANRPDFSKYVADSKPVVEATDTIELTPARNLDPVGLWTDACNILGGPMRWDSSRLDLIKTATLEIKEDGKAVLKASIFASEFVTLKKSEIQMALSRASDKAIKEVTIQFI